MSRPYSYSKIEDNLQASYIKPPIRSEFVNYLGAQLDCEAVRISSPAQPMHRFRLSRAIPVIIIVLIVSTVFAIGPKRVLAQIQQWLGYAPGGGLVSEVDSVRVLQEPVSLTRDGITVIVNDAVLTSDKTTIEYKVFGVPASENQKDLSEKEVCTTMPVIKLPKSGRILQEDSPGIFPPIGSDVDTVHLYLACIPGTSFEEVPADWELPLRFVPAPEGLVINPVAETSQPTPQEPIPSNATINQYFESDGSYILIGSLQPAKPEEQFFHIASVPTIEDSKGNMVFYETPEEFAGQLNEGDQNVGFAFKFNASGVTFPVKITFPVRVTAEPTEDLYIGEPQLWEVEWSPDTLPSAASQADSVCINQENILALEQLPESMDFMFITGINPDSIAFSPQGEAEFEVVAQGNSAVINPDGIYLASLDDQDLTLTNLTNEESFAITGAFSAPMAWSPAGSLLAVTSAQEGIEIVDQNGNVINHINLPNEGMLAGWSSDGTKLYFGVQATEGTGYLLRAIEVANGEIEDIFFLENSPGKNPGLAVSPDGNWIAYRGSKQATLYVKGMDESPAKLVMDAPLQYTSPTAIESFVWSTDSHYLAVEVLLAGEETSTSILLDLDGCKAYNVDLGDQNIKGVMPVK
ncbi:MAG: hypothetical protein WA116_00730 [Anaerolineaceae bacterium]